MRNRIVLASMLIVILLVAASVGAQDEAENLLEPREVVSGALVAQGVEVWVIEASAGDVLIIDAQSDEFDPVVQLFMDGELDETDDDSGIQDDARLITPPLPVDGTYSVLVSAAFASEAGAYLLTYDAFTPTAPGMLETGQLTFALFGDGDEDVWTVDYAASQQVRIDVASPTADLLIELRDAEGTVIASDDDSGGNLNPLLNEVLIENEGTYTIAVQPATSGDVSGAQYSIVTYVSGAEDVLEDDAILRSTIHAFDDFAVFEFEAGEGEVLTVGARSEDFDPAIRIYAEDNTVVAEDDDSGADFRAAQITDYVFETDGVYTIEVRTVGTSTGLFELRFVLTEPAMDE